MKTNVICPNCGAHVQLCENEHVVSNALVIGKDSGLGNVYLKLEDDRKQQLARHGIDTSKYFSISSPKGDDVLMRWNDNGIPEKVDDNDPVIAAIRNAGNVPNRRLFRRWVMAQMFRALSYEGGWWSTSGFTGWMKLKGYSYTWKQLLEELRVQAILSVKDEENYLMRNRWFCKGVLLSMCNDHITQLKHYVDRREIHKCKRVPYKRIGSWKVFLTDIEDKVFAPLHSAVQQIEMSSTPQELYESACAFWNVAVLKNAKFKQSYAWQDAFKGSGAYFTMRNLIMFHGALYVDSRDYNESLKKLDFYAKDCQGYEMLGALKEMLRRNNIDIKAKMAEWKK